VSGGSFASEPVVLPLRAGRGRIVLHAGGFRHPAAFGREPFTAYGDLTQVVAGTRALRIGSTRDVIGIPRSHFRDPADADRLAQWLLDRVAQEPDGGLQLARMAELDEIARRPSARWVTRAVVAVCLAAFGLELWLGPLVHHVGFFQADLAAQGEPWRLVTANLLHGGPVHLALNLLGVLVIGSFVERALGAARTLLVAGVAGLGATAVGIPMGYDDLVGASGIVAGLFAALLWLEVRYPERLPVAWRIPRRLLWSVLLLQVLFDWAVPFIASASHVGGFLAGGAAAALATGPGMRRERLAPALSLATTLIGVIALVSVVAAARLALGGRAMERHAVRLLSLDEASPQLLNDAAWLIATGAHPSRGALGHADELAERAVRDTERLDPNILDTLAEVQFQRGHADDAVDTIDEAIALAPEIAYFREQRRRFRGERDAADRPDPPSPFDAPAPPSDEPALPIDEAENPGIAI
jgi:membrane associated rhomboid family serine protease